LCSVSAEDGSYFIADVPAGQHPVVIKSDKFPFCFSSLDEVIALQLRNPQVTVAADTLQNFGLAEGLVHLPIRCEQMGNVVGASKYFDLDPGPGVRDWTGGQNASDGHAATDFEVTSDVKIVATLPSEVVDIHQVEFPAGTSYPNDLSVHVQTTGPIVPWTRSNTAFWVIYVHLQEVSVEVGDVVSKGDTSRMDQGISLARPDKTRTSACAFRESVVNP